MSSPSAFGVGGARREDPQNAAVAKKSLRKQENRLFPLSGTTPIAAEGAAGQAPRILAGNAGDHLAIHRFLLGVFQAPSALEFQAQLEDPFYEPSDRLLVKHGPQIVGHVRLTKREMEFGPLQLAIAGLSDLAVSPEYRGGGCATALLCAAEQQMARDGAMMGVLRTSSPQFFQRRGWAVCMRHSYSAAGPRDILSHLSALNSSYPPAIRPLIMEKACRPLNIRLWRHVEQAALTRLYQENTAGRYGPLRRNEAYWRWLMGRRGYDRIYVAIDGPDKLELDEAMAPIVGYAAVREGRIVEMMASQGWSEAPAQLLARACGDAIERGFHPVRLDAPPGEPLHELLVKAGGERRYHEAEGGEVFMVKLFDPLHFLTLLRPQLQERARASGAPCPCELGILVGGDKQRLVLGRKGVEIESGKLGRSYLTCSRAELTRLLLGHLDVREAVEAGRLEASTRVAAAAAAALFPQLPLWHPPLDELPA